MKEAKFSYTFGEDPEHRLEIHKAKRAFQVFVDDREIGTIEYKQLQNGKSFYLDDNSSLRISCIMGNWVILINGRPIPGSISPANAEDKGRVLKGASAFLCLMILSLVGVVVSSELRLAASIGALVWLILYALSFLWYSVSFFIAIAILLTNLGIIWLRIGSSMSILEIGTILVMPVVAMYFLIQGYIGYRGLRQSGIVKWYKR